MLFESILLFKILLGSHGPYDKKRTYGRYSLTVEATSSSFDTRWGSTDLKFKLCRSNQKKGRSEIVPFGVVISAYAGGHHIDDYPVGFFHTVAGEVADIADRVFHAFEDDALTAVELAVMVLHLHSEKTCFNRGCDLRRAAGLRAVADHTRINR